nr:CD1375 family protein [uncultured Faecalimonas sp.]
MVRFYVMKIKDGTITIDEVPQLWRNQVETELKK